MKILTHTELAVRVLFLLGSEGPQTDTPTKFIRTIYNRVMLENAVVRAAAVSALAKFGLTDDEDVRSSIRVLLTRCLDDSDDEVRDRAALNLRLIDESEDRETAKKFLRNDSMFSLPILEHQLVMYVTAESRDTFDEPFDLTKVPVVSRDQADAEERTKKLTAATPTLKAPSAGPKASKPSAESAAVALGAAQQKYAEELQKIPDIAAYGNLLKSSPPVELTESETEYVVKVCIGNMRFSCAWLTLILGRQTHFQRGSRAPIRYHKHSGADSTDGCYCGIGTRR